MTHFDGRFGFRQTSTTSLLHHNSPSFDYDVKVVTGLALPDDRLAILETAGFQRVGYRVPLPFLQRLCSIDEKIRTKLNHARNYPPFFRF